MEKTGLNPSKDITRPQRQLASQLANYLGIMCDLDLAKEDFL